MSLTAESSMRCPVLHTADQYATWKQRVTTACWAASHRDIFELKDEECAAALHEYKNQKKEKVDDWVAKCWMIITTSLHDELNAKISHITPGHIQSLLAEINAALVVNDWEDVQQLRMQLYASNMQKDCGSDLQSWVSFLIQKQPAGCQRP